ncbi:MATE family efflux transporter [Virgibacillus indicus]|uniref:Probable multidrug resistance protein NorM n=1 Tax=Virgibacillus indicus TaxID=2024554 RepID=A0A265NAS0_9BACI|nr:MATE family efflux transporter [Virgibacillus indicus]OZU89118.1 MATE family efflux transporter [Virgibacillus indicus]
MTNIRSKEITGKRWILFLAIPAVIENFFQTVIGFVDTLFISKIGVVEVSAVGVTNAVLQVYFAVFMAIGIAVNIYIARYTGANDRKSTKNTVWQSIYLAVFSGLLLGFMTLFFAEPLLQLMGAEEAVIQAGTLYFQIIAIPSVILALSFVLASIIRGTGDTKTPMKVSIWINIIHVFLDYIFIFGFLFIPGMGIVGAAIATVIVRLIGVIWLFIIIYKRLLKEDMNTFKFNPINWSFMKKLLVVGTPAAGERLVMRIGQVLYFGIIVSLGTATFAAHQIAGSIEVFSYMIGYGFATAATTIVSQLIGANEFHKAKKYAQDCVWIAVGFMSVIGLLLFIGAEPVALLFTSDGNVLNQIVIALRIDAFIQPVLAVVLVLTGVYQGGGNTKTPMYATTIGIWLIRTVGVYLLGVSFGLGIAGVWVAIFFDNLFRAIWLYWQFHKNRWTKAIDKEDLKEQQI